MDRPRCVSWGEGRGVGSDYGSPTTGRTFGAPASTTPCALLITCYAIALLALTGGLLMTRSLLKIAPLAIVGTIAACGGEASDASTRNDDFVGETARTEADFAGADCRASCPSAGVSGSLIGPISGNRVTSLDFTQLGTCAADPLPPPEGFHTKRAGEPCFLGRMRWHGQPLDGASVCEAFDCGGETGTFRTSACIAPSINSPAEYRSPPGGKCATRAEACAAAREVAARYQQRQLCL